MQKQIKRVPLVIVHESSPSDTDEESISNEFIQTERVSSPKENGVERCTSVNMQSLFNREDNVVSSITTNRISFTNENEQHKSSEPFIELQTQEKNAETVHYFTMYGSDSMDISNDESDKEDTKEENPGNKSTNQNAESAVISYQSNDINLTSVSKGCQNNFASHETHKLISHLNAFHGCNIDLGRYDADDDKSESSIDKFYSPFDLSTDDDFYIIPSVDTNKDSIEFTKNSEKHDLDWDIYKNQSPSAGCDLYLHDPFQSVLNIGTVDDITSHHEEPPSITQSNPQQISESLIWSNANMNRIEEHNTVSLADIEYRQSIDISHQQETNTAPIIEKTSTSSPASTNSPILKKLSSAPVKKEKKPLTSRVTPKVLRSGTKNLISKECLTQKELKIKSEQPSKPRISPRILATDSITANTTTNTTAKINTNYTVAGNLKKRPGPKPKSSSSTSQPQKKKSKTKATSAPDGVSSVSSYAPSSSRDVSSLEVSSNESTPELLVKTHNVKSSKLRREREQTPIPSSIITNQPDVDKNLAPGTEAAAVIPAIPRDGLWAFEYGFGFYMKSKYHCNVNRSSGFNGCKESFMNRSVFIQHLFHVHHLTAENALASRESEEDGIIHGKIIDMFISANLPPSFITNNTFIDMVQSFQNTSPDKMIIPSLEKTQHLMSKMFEKRENQLKKTLRLQKHLSFSIHTFKPLYNHNQTMICINVFYIGKDWSIKDTLIRFQTLPVNDNLALATEIFFKETIQHYGLSDKVYTVISPDFPIDSSNMAKLPVINMHISQTITKRVFSPCLDQIISLAKETLCAELSVRFGPLKKICRFKAKSLLHNWKEESLENVELLSKFCETVFKDYIEMLKEFTTIQQVYNNICSFNPRFSTEYLQADDILKIEKFLKIILTLDESNNWLLSATNQRYPTSNKTCLIYMEILNSLYQLAQCYGCTDENKMLFKMSYDKPTDEEDCMYQNINTSYSVVVKYRILMEASTENPTWQALILDTLSYGIYTARKAFYSKPKEMTPKMLYDTIISSKNISSCVEAQVTQIKQYITFKETLANFNNSETRNKLQPPENSSSLDENNTKKRNIAPAPAIINYKNLEKSLIESSLNTPLTSAHDKDTTMLSYLLHRDRNHFAQLNFWKNMKDSFYPTINELTKQCFAVPTTSKECLRIPDEAKIYYYGVINISPQASLEENQRRTLLHMWEKYSDILR